MKPQQQPLPPTRQERLLYFNENRLPDAPKPQPMLFVGTPRCGRPLRVLSFTVVHTMRLDCEEP